MEYRFSDKLKSLAPSAIREILKATSDPDVISFAAGNPAPDAFPVKELRESMGDILENRPIDALQYGISEGYTPLREAVKEDMKNRQNIGSETDDVLIVSGATQGIALLTQALCNEGDEILCEEPTFVGSLNAFRAFGAKPVGIPMEDDGISISALEEACKAHPRAKILYMIPNFQNPTGITTSWEKRAAAYEIAKKYGLVLLEDNPYGDLRFDGEPIPAIKTIDTDGVVAYCGSFSKVLAPGMRIGYMICHRDLMAKLTVGKQTQDVHTNALAQMAAAQFVTSESYLPHLAKLPDIYRRKYKIMRDAIDRCFPEAVASTHPQGGLFIWCTLPNTDDSTPFCAEAAKNKVAVVPGAAFLSDTTAKSPSFRMNFSTPTDEQLTQGCEILGKLLHEAVK